MRAVLCSLSLVEAGERLTADSERYFDEEESTALRGRPFRTWAGRMVLKEALARLWGSWDLPGEPRDFRIEAEDSGAPVLSAAPGVAQRPWGVRVSISHSRDTAFGLAVGPEVPP